MKKLILLAMMLAAPGAFGQRSISVSTNGMPAPSSAWGIQSAPTNLVWTGVHEDRSTRTNTAAGKVEFQGGFRVTTVATNENLRTPGWAQIGTMTNTVSFRAEGGFTVTGIATQGNARVTGWLELGGQFTNMSGILVASNITVALSASPPAGKIGLVASNNTWWLVTSAGVWTDLASGGSGVDATKVSTNNGIAYNLTNRESFRVEGGSTFIGISTQANTRITGSAFIQAGTNVDFTATSTSIGSSTTGVARVTGGLSSVGGTTNQGTAPTHQAAPLLVSGAFITVPVTNTALTVNLATNLAQAYTTNASYDVAFTGTALNGTRVEYRIWNTGATNIRVGIPGSFSIQAGAGITDITAVSNSLTRVIWTIIGGSNYVEVAGADQYQLSLGPNAAVGQPLEIMSLNGGLGGRMIITNGNDDVGAAGAVIRWQSNTVTIGSQTNFNIISTNHAEFGLLGTNNPTTGSADIHGYIGSAIARDAEVFGWLAGSNFATFANIQSSNYVDRTELANSNYVTAAAVFATDNRVLRSDGTGRGSQSSGLVIDDSANLGGIRNASITNAITNINGIMQFGGVRLEYPGLVDGLVYLDVTGPGGEAGIRATELRIHGVANIDSTLTLGGEFISSNRLEAIGTAIISPAQITANQNNYAPAGFTAAQVVRINSDAARDITGIQSLPIWQRLVRFDNVGAFSITFKDSNGGSQTTNQIASNGDLVLGPDESALFGYDVTSLRWRIESHGKIAAAGGGDVVGPASANDLAIAVFDSTTGKLIKQSGVTLSDTTMTGLSVLSATTLNGNTINSGTMGNFNALTVTNFYDYLWIPAGALTPANVNGATTNTYTVAGADGTTIDVFDFDDTTPETNFFTWTPPEDWDRGTFKVKPTWTSVTGTGTVAFGFRFGAISNDDPFGAILGTQQLSTDTLIASNDRHEGPATAAITAGGTPALGDMLLGQVVRETGSDTKTGDAKLIGIMIQYKRTLNSVAW